MKGNKFKGNIHFLSENNTQKEQRIEWLTQMEC